MLTLVSGPRPSYQRHPAFFAGVRAASTSARPWTGAATRLRSTPCWKRASASSFSYPSCSRRHRGVRCRRAPAGPAYPRPAAARPLRADPDRAATLMGACAGDREVHRLGKDRWAEHRPTVRPQYLRSRRRCARGRLLPHPASAGRRTAGVVNLVIAGVAFTWLKRGQAAISRTGGTRANARSCGRGAGRRVRPVPGG